tara:strand:+ start:499 stop:1410 length:912 start_codon:yes stop_codon:yes gene_type:complete
MTLEEAFIYMDMLLDKAEQPYFTSEEKEKYLQLATTEFVNIHYAKMGIDEESRKVMGAFVRWYNYSLSKNDIVNADYLGSYTYPILSEKYTDAGVIDTSGAVVAGSALSSTNPSLTNQEYGHFKYGNQYCFPENHLYTISCQLTLYNTNEVWASGAVYPGVTTSDIKHYSVPCTSVSIGEMYDHTKKEDPWSKIKKKRTVQAERSEQEFSQTNTKAKEAHYTYIEGRMIFTETFILAVRLQTLNLPTINRLFSAATVGGNSTSRPHGTLSDHYQRQIIQLAVRKMSGTTESGGYQIKDIESQK